MRKREQLTFKDALLEEIETGGCEHLDGGRLHQHDYQPDRPQSRRLCFSAFPHLAVLKTGNAPGLMPVGESGYFDVQSITVPPLVNLDRSAFVIGAIANGQFADSNTANNSFNSVQVAVSAAAQNGASPINIASGATAEIPGASAKSAALPATPATSF